MTGVQTLEARLGLAAIAGVAGVVLSELPLLDRPTAAVFRHSVGSIFLLSRLSLFGLVFLGLRIAPRGDVPSFYFSEAEAVLRGGLPYRDFTSSYAPLHAYVDAAVLTVWHSPLALILFAIVAEFVLLCLWLRLGGELFEEHELRVASVLYLTSAISLQFVGIDGQDNVLIALLVVTSLWLSMRSRIVFSGVVIAVGALAVKLIPIFYAPAFFAGVKRRWDWAVGFLAVLLAGYGGFAALRAPVLQPLAIEGPLKSSGTLPYLIESVTGLDLPVQFWNAIMLLILGLVYAAVWRAASEKSGRSRIASIVWGTTASTMVLLTFANKSWSPYLMLALFPLCVVVAGLGRSGRIVFAFFGIVALAEKSFWATLLEQEEAPELHRTLFGGDPQAIVFLAIQILLLLGYGWLLRGCVLRLLNEV